MLRRIVSLFSSSRSKRLVGEDQYGNKYFEIERADGKPRRSVECPSMQPADYEQGMIPTQWEAWVRGSIKDPPTLQELQEQEIMRKVIIEKAAEIKRKDDEAQRKAFEAGHASTPFYGHPNQGTEPTSHGATFEPGAWKPTAPVNKVDQQRGAEETEPFRPESWTPNPIKDEK
eukprot:gene8224-9104_t